jgi:hypothetical protein
VRALVLSVALVLGFGLASAAGAQPSPRPDSPEQSYGKPSGFWGSGRPVSNANAYRWRLLAVGGVIAGGMGVLMVRLIRKANRENQDRRAD